MPDLNTQLSLFYHLPSDPLQGDNPQHTCNTWVGLTAWWTAEEKRHLAVGHGLLGKIVVEDHSVLASVTEVLGHGTACVWCKELQWRSI